jgi:hypothetical protein
LNDSVSPPCNFHSARPIPAVALPLGLGLGHLLCPSPKVATPLDT